MALERAARCAYYGTLEDALDVSKMLGIAPTDALEIKNLRNYTSGKNTAIMAKKAPKKATLANPGTKAAGAFGEKIVRTVYGYLFGKDWTATGDDDDATMAFSALKPHRGEIRKACRDMLESGVGRVLVAGSIAAPRIVRLDPARTFDIIGPDGRPIAVVVTTGTDPTCPDRRIDVYTDKAAYTVTATGQTETPHAMGRIPVATFDTVDRRAVFESVIPLIDGHDALLSQGIDEVLRWAFSILVSHGRKLAGDVLEGEPGGVRVLHMEDGDSVEYLSRAVSIDLWGAALSTCREMIHDLSDVPDFASKDFGGVTGTALEYRLIGLETVCGALELFAADGVRIVAGLKRALTTTGAGAFVEVAGTVTFPRAKPKDELYSTQVAAGMKGAGLSSLAVTERLGDLLPRGKGEDADPVADEMARQAEETEATWNAMEKQIGQGQAATEPPEPDAVRA